MSDESPKDTTKLTKKQRRKAAQRRQLLTFLGIVVLVVVVAGAVLGVQKYRDSHDGTDPQDLRITAVTADGEEKLAPYSVCSFDDTDCGGDTSTGIALPADGQVTLKLPSDIYDHDWKLVRIYDDPAANTEDSYAANEMPEITLDGSSPDKSADGTQPRLAVAEIQTLLVRGSGDDEEPVAAVWSISPEGVEQDAAGDAPATGSPATTSAAPTTAGAAQ